MTSPCNHYFVDEYRVGMQNARWHRCIHCDLIREKTDNKPVNFRDVEVTKFWAKRLKELNKKG